MTQDAMHEQFVADTLARFDAFVAEAVQACPPQILNLSAADFRLARYELLKMMNERHVMAAGDLAPSDVARRDDADPDAGQYLPVTPAPWP